MVPGRAIRALPAAAALLLCLLAAPGEALAWGGEHHLITETALKALPADEQEVLRPEAAALAAVYCTFPDINWGNQGEWGEGIGNPRGPRFADARREWEVSRYTGDDPVLGVGRRLNHAPPDSVLATGIYFDRAADALREGKSEDAARIIGVMLHYVQDSGSFPHMQPFHRGIRVSDWKRIRLDGYQPRVLGTDPAEAAKRASERTGALVAFTEERLDRFLAPEGLTAAQVKERCARDVAPADLLQRVAKLRESQAAEWFALTEAACLESSRACADILHTLLRVAPPPKPAPRPNPAGRNLLFNPSFEEDDGDGVPDGWVAGWLDLRDRAGRAAWYRAGTHWEKHVHGGTHSALLLWAPEKGLEWRQTWPKAIRVLPGEVYECSAWIESRGAGGLAWVGLQVSDTGYQPLTLEKSEAAAGDAPWRQVRFRVTVPDGGKWLRVILHSTAGDGAAWFDDLSVTRVEP